MATLKDAKLIGGIGAVFSLIGMFIPNTGIILSIIGSVMVLIAVKYISDVVNDSFIFRNMIISIICGVVGVIAFVIFLLSYFMTMFFTYRGAAPRPFPQFIIPIIAAFVIVWVFMVFSALYLRKSYNRISDALRIDLFRSTATIYLVGALLLIVIVGVIVLILAKIIEAVAFFSIPEHPLQVQPPPPPS
jgi:uncharacterized membrane protein